MSSESSFERGDLIGDRFLLERKLGAGGAGVVWLATDQRTGRPAAVKLLHPIHYKNPRVFERFRREARLLIDLSHPNLARAIDWGAAPDAYVAMQYIEGTPLYLEIQRRSVEGRHFAVDEVEQIMEHVLAAVGYAHGLNIVHRDLKPENVLLEREGDRLHATVLDLGLAKLLHDGTGDATTIGRVFGSLLYMAPEQCLGQPPTPRTDVFALGAMLFEVVTLRRAWARTFDDDPMPAHLDIRDSTMNGSSIVMRRIVYDRRPRASDARPVLPPEIDGLIERAMSTVAAERPPDVASFRAEMLTALDALRRALEDPGGATTRATMVTEVGQSGGRGDGEPAPTVIAPQPLTAPKEGTQLTATPTHTRELPNMSTAILDTLERANVLVDAGSVSGAPIVLQESKRSRWALAVALAVAAFAGLGFALAVALEPAPETSAPSADTAVDPGGPRAEGPAAIAAEPRVPETPEAAIPSEDVEPIDPDPMVTAEPAASSKAKSRADRQRRDKAKPPAPNEPQPAPEKNEKADKTERAEAEKVDKTEKAEKVPKKERPYARLRRMLERVKANPADLDLLQTLSEGIVAASNQLPDSAARRSIERKASSSALVGDVGGVETALAELERAGTAP